MCKDFKF